MSKAVRDGTCLFGAEAVRDKLFEFVGPETIVIAHAGRHDLNVIRWIHPLIVDTQIVNTQSHRGKARDCRHALRDLCYDNFGISIQIGNKGHYSLEDALATRELAHMFVFRKTIMVRRARHMKA